MGSCQSSCVSISKSSRNLLGARVLWLQRSFLSAARAHRLLDRGRSLGKLNCSGLDEPNRDSEFLERDGSQGRQRPLTAQR